MVRSFSRLVSRCDGGSTLPGLLTIVTLRVYDYSEPRSTAIKFDLSVVARWKAVAIAEQRPRRGLGDRLRLRLSISVRALKGKRLEL